MWYSPSFASCSSSTVDVVSHGCSNNNCVESDQQDIQEITEQLGELDLVVFFTLLHPTSHICIYKKGPSPKLQHRRANFRSFTENFAAAKCTSSSRTCSRMEMGFSATHESGQWLLSLNPKGKCLTHDCIHVDYREFPHIASYTHIPKHFLPGTCYNAKSFPSI